MAMLQARRVPRVVPEKSGSARRRIGALATAAVLWALELTTGEPAARAQSDSRSPTPGLSAAGGATDPTAVAPAAFPPEGWWVPATLKMPRAADGRLAWRFTLREIITVSKDNKLERHPADLALNPSASGRPRSWKTTTSAAAQSEAAAAASPARPVSPLPPLTIEYDDKKGSVTLTFTGAKAAFFTLNPAGSEDMHRFDNLVIDKHADSAEVREACDKAARCCRVTQQPAECEPKNDERTLSHCKEVLTRVRQELAAVHQAIPVSCR